MQNPGGHIILLKFYQILPKCVIVQATDLNPPFQKKFHSITAPDFLNILLERIFGKTITWRIF